MFALQSKDCLNPSDSPGLRRVTKTDVKQGLSPPLVDAPTAHHLQPVKQSILFASIATLSSTALFAPVINGTPAPAFGEIVPADVQLFAATDLNRLRGNVVKALVRQSPYIDILEGGTLESGISDTQRVAVQERAVLNQSLVRPTFTLDKDMCGQTGPAAEVGSTEYTYSLETNRGKGPLVCIKGMWSAFKSAYSAAEDSLKKQLIQLNNSDVRITLVDRSGCKVVVKGGGATSFDTMFDGDVQKIDTPFPTTVGLPDAIPSIKFLQHVAQFMRETLLVEAFEGGQGEPMMKVIASQEAIDHLRDNANVREDHRYLAAGQYSIGKMLLTRYKWEGPYRGLGFGCDNQPLRFNEVNAQGQPVYLEPEIAVETDNGVGSRANPLWVRAKYEIMLLMGKDSFRKLTPESFTGEGSFRFPNQAVSGELKWENIKDNDLNVWQDYGRHYYQFSRAYKPERPHAVCAIAFARKTVDFEMDAITSFGNWSSTASL